MIGPIALSIGLVLAGGFLLWLLFDRDWPDSEFFGTVSLLAGIFLIALGCVGIGVTIYNNQPATTHTNCLISSRDESTVTTLVVVNKAIIPTITQTFTITSNCGTFSTDGNYAGTLQGHRYTITERAHNVESVKEEE